MSEWTYPKHIDEQCPLSNFLCLCDFARLSVIMMFLMVMCLSPLPYEVDSLSFSLGLSVTPHTSHINFVKNICRVFFLIECLGLHMQGVATKYYYSNLILSQF